MKATILLCYHNYICLQLYLPSHNFWPMLHQYSLLVRIAREIFIDQMKNLWVRLCRPYLKSFHVKWLLTHSAKENMAISLIYKAQFLLLPGCHAKIVHMTLGKKIGRWSVKIPLKTLLGTFSQNLVTFNLGFLKLQLSSCENNKKYALRGQHCGRMG